MASFRYRAQIPAQELGVSLNDFNADILVFAKPQEDDVERIKRLKESGKTIVVDFCDDHFDWPFYKEIADLADVVTCPTDEMARRTGKPAKVIPDPYEYPELAPHVRGDSLLWFGHAVNAKSLYRILEPLWGYKLRIVSNIPNSVPWSPQTMLREFPKADIVVMPSTAPYKSPNRTLEAIRQGCFVVAEPHPSLKDFPGIWIGNIKEGVDWAIANPYIANERVREAQDYIRDRYSPQTVGEAWKGVLRAVQCA